MPFTRVKRSMIHPREAVGNLGALGAGRVRLRAHVQHAPDRLSTDSRPRTSSTNAPGNSEGHINGMYDPAPAQDGQNRTGCCQLLRSSSTSCCDGVLRLPESAWRCIRLVPFSRFPQQRLRACHGLRVQSSAAGSRRRLRDIRGCRTDSSFFFSTTSPLLHF